jgi:peptide/nickel transport system substrate-binding protein
MTRRELMTRLGVGLTGATLGGVVAACISTSPGVRLALADQSPDASSTPTPGTTGLSPRDGGTLRFGNIGGFLTLEGETTGPEGSNDQLRVIWEPLISLDANHQAQPMLAESWEVANNGQQITFNLRQGVQFHTGRELTSDDVKFSLLRLQDPKIGSVLTPLMMTMTGVDTPDRYSVVVNASRPWVEVFDILNRAVIIDPVTLQSDGLAKPTGTGPFMFDEYAQGDHLRLVKNANYWQPGLPHLDEVLVSIYANAQAADVALEAGALDLVSVGMPLTDLLRLQSDPAYQVLINPSSGTTWAVCYNCTRPPTDNKLVRQALGYALDRKRIADTVWHGLEPPIVLPWNSASPAYDASKNSAYAFDLDTARALLAQAAPTTTALEIIWAAGPPEFETMAQIYQSDLQQLGLNVTLKPIEGPAFVQYANGLQYQGIRLAQASTANLSPVVSAYGGLYAPQTNFSGFQDDAYTQLVNQVASETDPTRQQQLYAQLTDYYLDQSWVQQLVPNPEHVVAQANVHGLRYNLRPGLVLGEVWLS